MPSAQRFEESLEENLEALASLLREGRYLPMPPRKTQIPKPDGTFRPLGILSVEDRIAQRAVLDALEPIIEPMFLDCSFRVPPGPVDPGCGAGGVVPPCPGLRLGGGCGHRGFLRQPGTRPYTGPAGYNRRRLRRTELAGDVAESRHPSPA